MTQDEEWLLQDKYHGEKTEKFLTDCARLENGEPAAYVIGWVPFLGVKIFLDSHPLIPRAETEFWVEQALTELPEESLRLLDLCAGSGCIGIAALTRRASVSVDFAELDERHHSTIEKNLRENSIDDSRAHIIGGDLFENIVDTYDVILSNPPYIDPVLDRTEDSVRRHEPHRALYGGTGGLELIKRIIIGADKHLSASGTLYIEHEPEQAETITELGREAGFLTETRRDQYGVIRYTRLVKHGRT